MIRFTSNRWAGIMLALGFFFACSPSKPDVDALIASNNYETALSVLDDQISEEPDNPELYFKKGQIIMDYTGQFSPEERGGFYEQAMESFSVAMENGLDSSKVNESNALINKYWAQEHNAGTAAYEESDDESHTVSIAHFRNAVILKPDELTSYLSLSTALYVSGEVTEAIQTLNEAKNEVQPVPPKVYENLGFLYLQDGNPEQSIFYYELANKDISSNKNIAFGLVNAYISTGNSEKAVDLLSDLSKKFPTDAAIKNVYGTQLYLMTLGVMNELIDAYRDEEIELAHQIRFEAEGMSEEAEKQLNDAFKMESSKTEYVESLAVYYNNMTGKYLEALSVASSEDQPNLKEKAGAMLNLAIEYYEKLQDMSPANSTYQSTINDLKELKSAGI